MKLLDAFDEDLVEVEYDELLAETDRAKLFMIDDSEVWIPKSQITYDEEGVFAIPRWLARKNDLKEGWEDDDGRS